MTVADLELEDDRLQEVLDELRAADAEMERNRIAARELRENVERQAVSLAENQRQTRQKIEAMFRVGGERKALLEAVDAAESLGKAVVSVLEVCRSVLAKDNSPLTAVEAHISAAHDFLAWLRKNKEFISGPVPPLDAARLPPAPTERHAEGFISIAEAKARSLAKKKQ